MFKITILVVILITCTSSNISAMDGNDLLSHCKMALEHRDPDLENLSDWTAGRMCIAYLKGVNELNFTYQEANLQTFFCLPDGIEPIQSARIVVKFLEEHPEFLHMPAMALIISSYMIAFPCK